MPISWHQKGDVRDILWQRYHVTTVEIFGLCCGYILHHLLSVWYDPFTTFSLGYFIGTKAIRQSYDESGASEVTWQDMGKINNDKTHQSVNHIKDTANKRRRYNVASYLTGRDHTQNDRCMCMILEGQVIIIPQILYYGFFCFFVDTLVQSDAIRHQTYCSTLVHIMAWRLLGTSHCMDQGWLIIIFTFENIFQWILELKTISTRKFMRKYRHLIGAHVKTVSVCKLRIHLLIALIRLLHIPSQWPILLTWINFNVSMDK